MLEHGAKWETVAAETQQGVEPFEEGNSRCCRTLQASVRALNFILSEIRRHWRAESRGKRKENRKSPY